MSEPRERYSIIQEPRGTVYRRLLQFLGRFCDEALLVTRDPATAAPATQQLLAELRFHQLSERDEGQWPGTKLIGHTARVHRYRFNDAFRKLLCSSVDGLYDWLSPDRPEDLCVLRSGTPVLTTIAHEREGYLDLSAPEYEGLLRVATGVVVHRGEIMPPSAEPYRLFGAFLDEDSLGAKVAVDSALAKYVSMASPANVEEAITAIRQAVFVLKDDAVLRVVLERWGAAPRLVAGASASSVLNKIADTLEQRRAAQQ